MSQVAQEDDKTQRRHCSYSRVGFLQRGTLSRTYGQERKSLLMIQTQWDMCLCRLPKKDGGILVCCICKRQLQVPYYQTELNPRGSVSTSLPKAHCILYMWVRRVYSYSSLGNIRISKIDNLLYRFHCRFDILRHKEDRNLLQECTRACTTCNLRVLHRRSASSFLNTSA